MGGRALWRLDSGRGIESDMLTPQIVLTPSHRDDLATICRIGAEKLTRVADRIEAARFTILREKVDKIIEEVAGPIDGVALSRMLYGIGASLRRRDFSAANILDQLGRSAASASDSKDSRFENWPACQKILERLLALPSIKIGAKAIDISYDFERVYVVGRVLTSIRPVFDDERRDILGSTVVQTLRLEYLVSDGRQENISVAMDLDDLRALKEECESAIEKAVQAKKRFEEKLDLEVMMPGEETK